MMNKALQIIGLFVSIFSYSQINCPFHLSLIESAAEYRRVEKKKEIHFYIENQHFLAPKSSMNNILITDLNKIKLKSLDDLVALANNARKKIINEGENKHSIRILNNDEVFKDLNIYEKVGKKIIRYKKVIWIEEIE